MANVKPNSSGTIDPSNIPIIVVICQIIHKVKPDPIR